MAGAIIPIVASAVSALVPVIPSIVQMVESLFGAKTGPQKLDTAVNVAQVIAEALAKSGKIQGLPDISTLTTLVQSAVQDLQAKGQLPGPTQPVAPAPASQPTFTGKWVLTLVPV